MTNYARVIDVPAIEEDEKAYNPNRLISSLLMHQLRQLHAAEQYLDPKERTGINLSKIHTELQASKYIRKVMDKLRPKTKTKRTETALQSMASARTTKKKTVMKK